MFKEVLGASQGVSQSSRGLQRLPGALQGNFRGFQKASGALQGVSESSRDFKEILGVCQGVPEGSEFRGLRDISRVSAAFQRHSWKFYLEGAVALGGLVGLGSV